MAVNQLESNLEAISRTITVLKMQDSPDADKIKELEEEREKILKDLKII